MANFSCGSDSDISKLSTEPIEFYWINLDHVCFLNQKDGKLTLKMSDKSVFVIEGEDVNALKQVLCNQTLKLEEEYIDGKRYNHEDVPTKEEV